MVVVTVLVLVVAVLVVVVAVLVVVFAVLVVVAVLVLVVAVVSVMLVGKVKTMAGLLVVCPSVLPVKSRDIWPTLLFLLSTSCPKS